MQSEEDLKNQRDQALARLLAALGGDQPPNALALARGATYCLVSAKTVKPECDGVFHEALEGLVAEMGQDPRAKQLVRSILNLEDAQAHMGELVPDDLLKARLLTIKCRLEGD